MHSTLPLLHAAVGTWRSDEIVAAIVRPLVGALLAFGISRLARHAPWPRPFRARFLALHAVVAPLAAVSWMTLSAAIEAVVTVSTFAERMRYWTEFLVIGCLMYVIIAGVSYAAESTARAAQAEALAARTQLAALRAQVQPHFLFNALHTIVQLIPIEPQRAMEAGELVAGLLRTTLEEQRDEIALGDEWRFVSRYLAIERMRFGDRLVVRAELPDDLLDECVPAFALQTLVENAVQHGAAPRVAPTEIVVSAMRDPACLTLTVRNSGDGASSPPSGASAGTGLARLRERLAVLYADAATITCGQLPDGGYSAELRVPHRRRAA